ncbi:MAG: autotransporter-associated beta strand repeat-containing protein, partial [Verrucomicrobiota bacterium]
TVDFKNPLNLATADTGMRTIRVENGSAAIDAKMSGGIIDGAPLKWGIIKTGDGTLELSGANTYDGETQIQAGSLLVSGSLTKTSHIS